MKRIKNELNLTKRSTWKCDHCKPWSDREETRPKFRPSLKKWKRDDLLQEVRNAVENSVGASSICDRITAEDYANRFRARVDMIRWCFMKLNHEGLLNQRVNNAPHDSRREFPGPSYGDNSWCASTYNIIKKD